MGDIKFMEGVIFLRILRFFGGCESEGEVAENRIYILLNVKLI